MAIIVYYVYYRNAGALNIAEIVRAYMWIDIVDDEDIWSLLVQCCPKVLVPETKRSQSDL
jgi:hypothetical protein